MKKLIILFQFVFILALSNCISENEKVELNPDISIEFPGSYKYREAQGMRIFEFSSRSDYVVTSIYPIEGADTLSSDQLAHVLESNAVGFIKGFNGKEIYSSGKAINDTAINEFIFEYNKNDSLFSVFGNAFVHNNNMYILAFRTIKPVTNKAQKRMDRFFNSILFK